MKNIILTICLLFIATASYASFILQGLELQGVEIGGVAGVAPSADALLLETGDFLLLETGDKLLLE